MNSLTKMYKDNLESVTETAQSQATLIIELKKELADLKRSTSNELYHLKEQLRYQTDMKNLYKNQYRKEYFENPLNN